MFDSPTTRAVLRCIKETYGSEPEFLWAKSPGNAVFRHRENGKWYAALLRVPRAKLGLDQPGEVDILDLKCDSRVSGSLLDGKRCFPGYHMNKEHWITLLLDGSLSIDEITPLLDLSYQMTGRPAGGSTAPRRAAGEGRGTTDE